MELTPNDTEDLRKLQAWQQGDYALDCGEFWFRGLDKPIEEGSDELSDFGVDDSVEGFVVISQTCDVIREPSLVPFVSVCPLVKVDEVKRRQLEKGLSPKNCFLADTPQNVVVDLSRVMTISKELLITWERRRGCPSTAEQREFSRALQGVYGRFAFPEDFVSSVKKFRRKVVDSYAKEQSELGQAFRSIRELRVLPHSDWSSSESVQITFIAILDELDKRELKDRSKVASIVEDKLDAIEWIGRFSIHEDKLLIGTLADIRAVDYVNSYPLDVNSLSFARRFANDDK